LVVEALAEGTLEFDNISTLISTTGYIRDPAPMWVVNRTILASSTIRLARLPAKLSVYVISLLRTIRDHPSPFLYRIRQANQVLEGTTRRNDIHMDTGVLEERVGDEKMASDTRKGFFRAFLDRVRGVERFRRDKIVVVRQS
jgi:hypothetical protein